MSEGKTHRLIFRADDEEYEFIKEKMARTNCKSMSQFLRRCVLKSYIVNIDTSELTEMKKLIKSISDNINQISKLANSQKSIYKEEIDEIKEKVTEIWQQQAYILSLLRKLER